MNKIIDVAAADGCSRIVKNSKQKETTMKKNNTNKEVKSVKEVKEVKVRAKRTSTKEMQMLNGLMRGLRKNLLVKGIPNSPNKDNYITTIEEMFKQANEHVTSMQNTLAIEQKFSSMTDVEKEYLKKMLND